MKLRYQMMVILLSLILALGRAGMAEASDRFYIRITVALGGLSAGVAGLFFLVVYHGEAEALAISSSSALFTWDDKGLSWARPELIIRPSPLQKWEAGGIEGYACLFRVRFR